MRFKVGEKVKVIKEGSHGQGIGTICEITKIDKGNTNMPYLAKCPNGIEMWFYEKQLGKMQFTKSDLKDGDIVIYRCGGKRTKIVNELKAKNGEFNLLSNYKNDLTDKDGYTELDIIKVERPTQYETVFERKEEILDEAEKRYLRGVIRPFRKEVASITKMQNYETQFIRIKMFSSFNSNGHLPSFKSGTMYKKMEAGKEYTLEELRTIKE